MLHIYAASEQVTTYSRMKHLDSRVWLY